MNPFQLGQVFVAGGQPSLTYVDRPSEDALGTIEDRIRNYLIVGHKALTVSGPTKSGKTVVCRKVIPQKEGVWIEGGAIRTEDEFWVQVCETLGIGSAETTTVANGHTVGGSFEANAQGKLPFVFEAGGKGGANFSGTNQTAITTVAARSLRKTAIEAMRVQGIPLVIDDFHYIDRLIQTALIRSLKGPIFDGLRVVFIAVPHRAFDAVRSEREMTGRVDQLSIGLWSQAELRQIALAGFPALNVDCKPELLEQFIHESQGSPHLMQEFCSQLCLINKVSVSEPSKRQMVLSDERVFFKRIAASTAKPAFDRLARGPRQRTDRKQRPFADGSSGDIYVAVLRALSNCGVKTKMTYEDIRASLKSVLSEEAPQAHEVGRVLVQMSKIAKKEIQGEAVLEWDVEESVLHVADPFFAFYLRWAD